MIQHHEILRHRKSLLFSSLLFSCWSRGRKDVGNREAEAVLWPLWGMLPLARQWSGRGRRRYLWLIGAFRVVGCLGQPKARTIVHEIKRRRRFWCWIKCDFLDGLRLKKMHLVMFLDVQDSDCHKNSSIWSLMNSCVNLSLKRPSAPKYRIPFDQCRLGNRSVSMFLVLGIDRYMCRHWNVSIGQWMKRECLTDTTFKLRAISNYQKTGSR